MNYNRLSGIYAAAVTPLNEKEEIDQKSLQQSIEYLMNAGIHGLFICGSTGECVLLEKEERITVAETAMRIAGSAVPVIVHVGGLHLKEVLYLAKHAESIGANGIAVIPPFYYAADEKMLVDYFCKVASSVPDTPVYLYNIPQNAKNPITYSVANQVRKLHSNVVGVKESSGDFNSFCRLKENCTDLDFFMGNDAQVLPALAMGAVGAVSAHSSVFPTPFLELYRAYQNNDMQAAREWQSVCAQLKNILTQPFPMSTHKKALELMRVIESDTVRYPLRKLTSSETDRLIEGLKNLKLLAR